MGKRKIDGVRDVYKRQDYIHVVDLAKGHVKALKKIEDNSGLNIYNLGTGKGYSVLDIVKNFEEATGVKIPYVIRDRRPGDIATCYSDAGKAEAELGWKAEYGIKAVSYTHLDVYKRQVLRKLINPRLFRYFRNTLFLAWAHPKFPAKGETVAYQIDAEGKRILLLGSMALDLSLIHI